jgi:hypothetical protein
LLSLVSLYIDSEQLDVPIDALGSEVALVRKLFAEFAAELAAGLRAGRGDEPIAESARLGVIEVAPDDWRLVVVLDHAVEVVCDESFATREEATEEIIDRLEDSGSVDQLRTERPH